MEKKDLILIGGGGHCKSCIDVIESQGIFNIQGILDSKEKAGSLVLGYPIIGTDEDIPHLIEKDCHFLITLGQIKTAAIRRSLYDKLKSFGGRLGTVISPQAIVSKYAKIGEGTIIMHNVTINASANIGVNCIINTGAIIEHDAVIGKHCHISTHAVVNGDCTLGNEIFIGSGSVINNNLSVVDDVVVGSGSVVHKNINESDTFAGNPLKKIKYA